MKIGVIISSNDAQTSWNALRYANFCLGQKDEVKVFLTVPLFLAQATEKTLSSTKAVHFPDRDGKRLDSGKKRRML
jgi:hypothetical protein